MWFLVSSRGIVLCLFCYKWCLDVEDECGVCLSFFVGVSYLALLSTESVIENGSVLGCMISTSRLTHATLRPAMVNESSAMVLVRCMHRTQLNPFVPTHVSSLDVCGCHPTEAHWSPFRWTIRSLLYGLQEVTVPW
jgi:hypothetical protein